MSWMRPVHIVIMYILSVSVSEQTLFSCVFVTDKVSTLFFIFLRGIAHYHKLISVGHSLD